MKCKKCGDPSPETNDYECCETNFNLLAERVYYDWHGERTDDLILGIKNALIQADADGFRRGVESVKCNCACEGCMEHDANWNPNQAGGGV